MSEEDCCDSEEPVEDPCSEECAQEQPGSPLEQTVKRLMEAEKKKHTIMRDAINNKRTSPPEATGYPDGFRCSHNGGDYKYGTEWRAEHRATFVKSTEVMICVCNRLEVTQAMGAISRWAERRPGHWTTIPYELKRSDPLFQRGYIAFRLNEKGEPAECRYMKVFDVMTMEPNHLPHWKEQEAAKHKLWDNTPDDPTAVVRCGDSVRPVSPVVSCEHKDIADLPTPFYSNGTCTRPKPGDVITADDLNKILENLPKVNADTIAMKRDYRPYGSVMSQVNDKIIKPAVDRVSQLALNESINNDLKKIIDLTAEKPEFAKVHEMAKDNLKDNESHPLFIGVDPASPGGDQTVHMIRDRHGIMHWYDHDKPIPRHLLELKPYAENNRCIAFECRSQDDIWVAVRNIEAKFKHDTGEWRIETFGQQSKNNPFGFCDKCSVGFVTTLTGAHPHVLSGKIINDLRGTGPGKHEPKKGAPNNTETVKQEPQTDLF